MAVNVAIPALPVVLTTALIDSINPCAIGVLVLLIATLLAISHNRRKMITIGLIYIGAVFLTYLAAGFGLLIFIQKLNISEPLSYLVGGIVILLGAIEIKDFFWYGKGISLQIPRKRAEQILKYIKTRHDSWKHYSWHICCCCRTSLHMGVLFSNNHSSCKNWLFMGCILASCSV